jgi:hypothetical protein
MTRDVRAAGRRELLRAEASRAAEQARADELQRSLRDEAEAGGAAARRAAAAECGIDWLGAELAEARRERDAAERRAEELAAELAAEAAARGEEAERFAQVEAELLEALADADGQGEALEVP